MKPVSESETHQHAAARKKIIFRKNWLIYPRFQLLLIGCNFGIVTLAFWAVAMGIHHYFAQLHQQGVASGLSSTHYYFNFVGNVRHRLYDVVAIAYGLSVLISSALTLVLSQKISGPIIRLRTYFEAIENGGPVRPLDFRQGDFFAELPPTVNRALQRLK